MINYNFKSCIAKLSHRFNGFLIFLGVASTVTQNSDSAYIGLGLAFLFLFWFSFENYIYWKNFIEILILSLVAIKITGFLQNLYPERVPALSPISIEITQGNLTFALFILVLFIYITTLCVKNQLSQSTWSSLEFKTFVQLLRIIIYIFIAIAILSLPLLIWLTTTGRLPVDSGILNQSGYLIFDDSWGSYRGRSWKYALFLFNEFSPSMKLLGCGPDGLYYYLSEFHYEDLKTLWGGMCLTNVHNEWLNSLVNYGVTGAIAYISIFVIAIVHAFQNRKKNPILIALGAAVLSYAGHNFFCYQQSVCTPLIFIIIGIIEFYLKNNSHS